MFSFHLFLYLIIYTFVFHTYDGRLDEFFILEWWKNTKFVHSSWKVKTQSWTKTNKNLLKFIKLLKSPKVQKPYRGYELTPLIIYTLSSHSSLSISYNIVMQMWLLWALKLPEARSTQFPPPAQWQGLTGRGADGVDPGARASVQSITHYVTPTMPVLCVYSKPCPQSAE